MLHKVLKGEQASNDPFEGMGREKLSLVENLHLSCRCINADGHALPFPLLANGVVRCVPGGLPHWHRLCVGNACHPSGEARHRDQPGLERRAAWASGETPAWASDC